MGITAPGCGPEVKAKPCRPEWDVLTPQRHHPGQMGHGLEQLPAQSGPASGDGADQKVCQSDEGSLLGRDPAADTVDT